MVTIQGLSGTSGRVTPRTSRLAKYLGEGSELLQAVAGANTTTDNGFINSDEPLPFGLFPLLNNTAYTSEGRPENVDPDYVNGQPVAGVGYFNFPNTHMMVVAPGHLPVLSLSIPEQVLTFRFTLPDAGPTLVRSIPQKGLWPYETIVDGDTIEVKVHTTMRSASTPTGFIADMALSLNGQPYPGRNVASTQGTATSYNWTWGIESTRSGPHRAVVTLEKPGPSPEIETQIDTVYVQKALRLTDPLEDMLVAADQTTPVNFDNTVQWDNGDSAAGQNVTWSVTISDPAGVIQSQTKTGTGPIIQAQFDPITRVLSRGQRNTRGGRTVHLVPTDRYPAAEDRQTVRNRGGDYILTYAIQASADTYTGPNLEGVIHAPPPRYQLAQQSVLPRGVTISGLTTDPTNFNPVAGENTTIRAHLEINGFESPQVDWTCRVHPASDPAATVALFTDSATATSGSSRTWFADIEITWDGRVSEDITIPPGQARQINPRNTTVEMGDYKIELSVTVTEQGGGEPRTANATADVTVGGGPRLEIREGSNLLAFDGQDLSNEARLERSRLQQRVNPFNGSSVWNVTLTGSRPEDRHVLVLQSRVSGPQPSPVTLTAVNGSTTTYQANVTINDNFIKDLDSSYCLVPYADVGDSDTSAFDMMMKLADNFIPYPIPRKYLGRFQGATAATTSDADPELAPVDIVIDEPYNNVRNCGFEDISTLLLLGGDRGRLTTHVKVRHPARVMWLNSHGFHDGTLTLSSNRTLVPGVDLKREDMLLQGQRVVKTIIMGSCAALDFHDYNNVYALPDLRPSPTGDQADIIRTIWSDASREHAPTEGLKGADGKPLRVSPGLKWWEALNGEATNPPTILLGYSAPLAKDGATNTTLALVLAEYSEQLKHPPASSVAGVPPEPLAWLVANLKVGQKAVLADSSNLNANLFTAFGAARGTTSFTTTSRLTSPYQS